MHAVLIFTVYFSIAVIPESGCRKKWATVLRTQRLIREQTTGGGREMIPTISGRQDFLKNTEDKNHRPRITVMKEFSSVAVIVVHNTN